MRPAPLMAEDDRFKGKSVEHHMVVGSAWMVAMRWSMRAIGVVSTVILARLLAPEDFGVVAMALITVALVEVLMESGLRLALIRHENPTRAHYDTAFTLYVLVGVTVCVAVQILAPIGAAFFDEPRAELPIRLLGLRALLMGFENIGTVNFLRNLDYARDFRFNVLQKMISVSSMITLALIFRSYWALVFGLLGSRVVTLVLSYVMEPYRPRFDLSKTRELWGFSLWSLGISYASFLLARIDELVVGRVASVRDMGYYNVAADVATVMTFELIMPMYRSLFPIYAKLVDEPARLAEKFLQAFSIACLVCFSCGVGVALVADDLVAVAFGEKWAYLSVLIPWLAVAGGFQMLSFSTTAAFQAVGRPHLPTMLQWSALTCLIVALPIGFAHGGVEGVAMTRAGLMAAFVPVTLFVFVKVFPVTLGQLVGAMWRPFGASLAMAGTLMATPEFVGHHAPDLVIDIVLGATVFSATLLCLWALAGRPPGAERFALQALARGRERFGGQPTA